MNFIFFYLQANCTDTDIACQKSALLQEYKLDVSAFQQAFPNIQNKIVTGALIASCAATVYHYSKKPCLSIAYGATFAGCLSITLGEIIEYLKYQNQLKKLKENLEKKFNNDQKKEESFRLQALKSAIASEELTKKYFKNKIIYYIVAGALFVTATIAPLVEPINEPSRVCSGVQTSPSAISSTFFLLPYAFAQNNDFFSTIGSISSMMNLFKIKNIFPAQEKLSKLSANSSGTRTAFAGAQTAATTMSILAFNQLKNQAQNRQEIYLEQVQYLAQEQGLSLCNNLPCDLTQENIPGLPKITDSDLNSVSPSLKEGTRKLLNQETPPESVNLDPFLATYNKEAESFKKSINPETQKVFQDYPESPSFSPITQISSDFTNMNFNSNPEKEISREISSSPSSPKKNLTLPTKGAKPQTLFHQIEARHQKQFFQKGTTKR